MKNVLTHAAIVGFCICSALPGAAAGVVVRSGEHDGFSRIVLHFEQPVDWTLTGEGRDYSIDVEEAVTWNLQDAFYKISNRRVKSLVPRRDRPGLAFKLNCDCAVDAFWHRQSMLVVDVQDPATEEGAPYGSGSDAASTPSRRRLLPRSSLPAVSMPRYFPSAGQSHAVELATDRFTGVDRQGEETGDLGQVHATDRLSYISDGIHHAAALGLVQAAPAGDIKGGRRDHVEAPETDAYGPPSLHISVENSAERLPNGSAAQWDRESLATGCTPDELLNVAQWGSDAPFSAQVGELRRSLHAEGTRIEQAALALARLYIFFGFGAEARQVIETHGPDGRAANVVLAMADVVDDHAPASTEFSGQTQCDGSVALWAILGAGRDAPKSAMNEDAMLTSLVELPHHLGSIMAPRLSKLLLARGKKMASERVLRISDRSPVSPSADHSLERLKTTPDALPLPERESALWAMVGENTEASPLALVELIDSKLDALAPVPEDWVELVGSYVREQGPGPVRQMLTHSHIGALAASGQFDRAFTEMGDLAPAQASSNLGDTWDLVARYALEDGDTIMFLKKIGYRGATMAPKLSPATANGVARRLIDLGFPKEALDFIPHDAVAMDQETRRILRGEAALQRAKPLEAIASVMGMEGADAEAIRAKANRRLGRPGTAAGSSGVDRIDDDQTDARDFGMPGGPETAGDMIGGEGADSAPQSQLAAANGTAGQLHTGERLLQESKEIRGRIAKAMRALQPSNLGAP